VADIYLHQLPDSAPLTGAEYILVDQAGNALRATVNEVVSLVPVVPGPPGPAGPTGPAGPAGPSLITVGTTPLAPPGANQLLRYGPTNKVDVVPWPGSFNLALVYIAPNTVGWVDYQTYFVVDLTPYGGVAPSTISDAVNRLSQWLVTNSATLIALGLTNTV